jgi:outer membrane protein OmpA-like peptidoglycan-associated protein
MVRRGRCGSSAINRAAADTILRDDGSWTADGFRVDQRIVVAGSADNDDIYTIRAIDAAGTLLTLDPADALDEEPEQPDPLPAPPQATTANIGVYGLATFNENATLEFIDNGADVPDTIRRIGGARDWAMDGFAPGQRIEVQGSMGTMNDRTFTVASIAGAVLTLSPMDVVVPQGPTMNVTIWAVPPRWESVNGNLNLTEYYAVAFDEVNNTVLGGSQDVGTSLQTVTSEVAATLRFATGVDELTDAQETALDDLAIMLDANPSLTVEVGGHTDDVGDADENLRLSLARARVVADYLIGEEIDAARLRVEGYGQTRPVGNNATSAGRTMNRRVELYILPKAV